MKLREKDEENKMPDSIRRNGRTLWDTHEIAGKGRRGMRWRMVSGIMDERYGIHMKLRERDEEDDGGWYPA